MNSIYKKNQSIPTDPIKLKYFWNQIIIDALSQGKLTGCFLLPEEQGNKIKCKRINNLCNKCFLDADMMTNPNTSFESYKY